jgi:hypothetical protein
LGEGRADRVGKAHVTDYAIAEKRIRPALGHIDKLVRNDHISGMDRLSHGSHCADTNDPLDAKQFHSIDICPEVECGRMNTMAFPVAGQECDLCSLETAHDERI